MSMIFETHAHYDNEQFDEDREALLASLPGKGIGKIINVSASLKSVASTLELAEKHSDIYPALGIHPSDCGDLNEEAFAWLKEQAKGRAVAIGEIGLDYHWEKDPAGQERQRYWFARQMELARELKLPVIIHSREAAADTMEILKEAGNWKPLGEAEECGVIHCYSYSPEMAREFVKLGYMIGVGGVVTFQNARKLKETVRQIPLGRILLETDCPYMAPVPFRGKRNDSSYLSYVAGKIAELKEISPDDAVRATWENAMRLFPKAR